MKSNLSQGEARIPRTCQRSAAPSGVPKETWRSAILRNMATSVEVQHSAIQPKRIKLIKLIKTDWSWFWQIPAASGWSPFPNNVDESKKITKNDCGETKNGKENPSPTKSHNVPKHRNPRTSQSWAMCSEPHRHRLNKHTAFGNWSSWKLLDNLATEWYNPKNIQHKQCTFSSGLCRNTSLRLRQTKQNMKETVRLHCQGSWTCWRCTLLILGYLWILWILSNKSSTFRNTSKMLTVSPWALRLGPWDLSICPHP